MAVVQKCVFLLLVALALSDVTRAQNWREYLEYRREMQQQQQQVEQEQQEPPQEPLAPEGGKLRSYVEQLRLEREMRERQAEIEKAHGEEMGELIQDYNMEELSHKLGTAALGRILRPLREYPTEFPIDDCVKGEWPLDFGIPGIIKYEVCGTGDSSSVKMRFVFPGDTTPATETTAATETTTPAETTPEQAHACPHDEQEEEETTTEEPTAPAEEQATTEPPKENNRTEETTAAA